MSPRPIRSILITGAGGNLGRQLRDRLRGHYDLIRLTDVAGMEPARDGSEEVAVCDLGDTAGVHRLCEGIDGIVHLGGRSTEGDWEIVNRANIQGAFNLWEGARLAGVDRVLFASSNHAVGLYRRGDRIDHTTAARPDSRYGLSKAFAEDVAALYAYKFGVRGFMMRIGSCFAEPTDQRQLASWMSFADFARLINVGLKADYTYEIVYGISRNTRAWYDNSNAYRLGYDPQDDAETYAAKVMGKVSGNPIAEDFQGSVFASNEFVGDPARVPPFKRT